MKQENHHYSRKEKDLKIEASITINKPGEESYAIITKDKKEILRISATSPEIIASAAQNILMMACHDTRPEFGVVNPW
jgi:hypothetical protein